MIRLCHFTRLVFVWSVGLGFYIRGGLDIPHTPCDPGIFISRMEADGVASKSKALKEGDKIISVNGENLEHIMHIDAVRAFVNSGLTVEIEYQPAAYAFILNRFMWAKKFTVRELWPASFYMAQYVIDPDKNITVWKATKG